MSENIENVEMELKFEVRGGQKKYGKKPDQIYWEYDTFYKSGDAQESKFKFLIESPTASIPAESIAVVKITFKDKPKAKKPSEIHITDVFKGILNVEGDDPDPATE